MLVRKRTSKIIKPKKILTNRNTTIIIALIILVIILTIILADVFKYNPGIILLEVCAIVFILKVKLDELELIEKRYKKIYNSSIYIINNKDITKNLINNQNYMPKMYRIANHIKILEKKEIFKAVFAFFSIPFIIISISHFFGEGKIASFIIIAFISFFIFLGTQCSKRYDKGYIWTSYKKDEIMKVEKEKVDNL